MNIPTGQNYTAWDNTEAITFIRHGKLIDDEYPIATAKRRNPSFKEMAASGGVYTGQDLVWLVPATLLTAAGLADVKPADIIRDANGVVWTVLERSLNTLRSTWRCVTRDLILAYDLRDTLSVRRPQALTTDAAATREYVYDTIYTAIPCRFQAQGDEVSDERGQRLTVSKYSVWVGQRLYLTNEDQIVDEAGNIYELKSTQDADRIDQLQRLDCERRW